MTPSEESESFPAELSVESQHTQDTTLQIKPAKTEACPVEGTASSSTKDFKAIITTTKETSTASVPFTDQPMEVSLSQPSKMDVVGAPFLETAPKELLKERGEGIFHRNLAETVKPSASGKSEEMYSMPESKPNLSISSLSSEEKPLKTSVERLAEMVSFPSHSSPLGRGTSPREPPQTQILPSLGDHSSVMPTTLIPLTPKIGMGKPAITKRKFSPGRPRVKQVGTWISCHRRPLVRFMSLLGLFCLIHTPCPSNELLIIGAYNVCTPKWYVLWPLSGLWRWIRLVRLVWLKQLIGIRICFLTYVFNFLFSLVKLYYAVHYASIAGGQHGEWFFFSIPFSLFTYLCTTWPVSHSVHAELSWTQVTYLLLLLLIKKEFLLCTAKTAFSESPCYIPPYRHFHQSFSSSHAHVTNMRYFRAGR